MLAVQPLSQAPSKLPPMQDTCAAWWMHCFPSACLSPSWPPQNLISYKRSRTATWGPDLFGMTLKQSIEISLCIDIYRALGGSDSYCNAARLKFDLWAHHTAKQPLSQHQGVVRQDHLPACKRGNYCFAVTVELVVLTLMVFYMNSVGALGCAIFNLEVSTPVHWQNRITWIECLWASYSCTQVVQR